MASRRKEGPYKKSYDERWYERLTWRLWQRILFILICAAPFLTGMYGRLTRHDHVFSDYEAIACAGERMGQGLPIYGGDLACAGMEPYPYLYLPWVAKGQAALSNLVGPLAAEIVYAALFLIAIAYLVDLLLIRFRLPGDFWDRLPALGLVTGGTIYSGNIAVIWHAILLAAAMFATRLPWLFAIAVAVAAGIKPTFLTYGLVLLVIPIPIWQRLLWGAVAAIGGLAPFVLFLATGSDTAGGWTQTLQTMMFKAAPGVTFVGWLNLFGVVGLSPAAIAGWLALVAVLTTATIVICVAGLRAGSTRTWLAVGVAALANPRLMEYDTPLLLCLLGAMMDTARLGIIDETLRRRVVGALAGFGMLAALGNSLDAGDYTSPLFTFAMCVGLIILAWILWRDRDAISAQRERIRGGHKRHLEKLERERLERETKEGGPSGPPSP